MTFYLDGHKLKTLTAHNAHNGTLSIKVSTKGLKVGAHKLSAKIVMTPASASAKAVTTTRTLMFVVCGSAAVVSGRAGGGHEPSGSQRKYQPVGD